MMALLGPQLLRASADDLNDPATCHAKVWRELCYNVLLFLLPSFLFFPVFFFLFPPSAFLRSVTLLVRYS